jgi:hypothetical protein
MTQATGAGVLYIAFGHSFTKEGVMSYRSLRRHMPHVKVCFMTDRVDLLSPHESDVNLIVTQIQPRHIRSKVDFVSESPFDKTLYLDSDTIVARDLSDVFESLDRFDVALTHDFARKRKKYADVIPEYAKIPYAFSEVNGGVFGFAKNERTDEFLRLWKSYFYKYFNVTNGWDQVSLRISLWESKVSLFHLPVEFNIRSQAVRDKQDRFKHEYGEQHMAPRIYHMHYDPEVHRGVYAVDSLEDLEDRLKQMAIKY